MRKLVKEILFLKKGEQRALLVISLLLFASLIFRVSVSRKPSLVHQSDGEFLVQVENLREKLDQKEQQMDREAVLFSPTLNPMVFDPNKASREKLLLMGFPERALINLLKYREAGGKFKKPEDLGKVYGLDSLSFSTFFDFVVIEDQSVKFSGGAEKGSKQITRGPDWNGSPDAYRSETSSAPLINVELNGADSLDLIKIKGIGPVYSSRILRYRALLGGFYSIEQLWDIYGMDSMKYSFLSASLYIDTSLLRRKDINEASFYSLVRHPYFSQKEASDLIHYRNFAGEIKELTELKANQVIDSSGYERMKHYLKCRNSKY